MGMSVMKIVLEFVNGVSPPSRNGFNASYHNTFSLPSPVVGLSELSGDQVCLSQ